MKKDADEVIVLETPAFFRAVAQSYANWYDVPDSEVVAIMDKWREKRRIDKGGLR
jgi:putative phosphoribosyl transferase